MKRLFREYYRYVIVGAGITLLDFAMLATQVEILNVYYLIAAGVSFSLASILHYYLSANYVFSESKAPKNLKSFLIFFGLGLMGVFFLECLMFYFVEILKFYYLIAKVFATGFIFTFNFTTRRFLLFK